MCWEQPLSKSKCPSSTVASHINELHFSTVLWAASLLSTLCVCAGLVLHALCLLVRDIHSSWFEGEVLGLRERILSWRGLGEVLSLREIFFWVWEFERDFELGIEVSLRCGIAPLNRYFALSICSSLVGERFWVLREDFGIEGVVIVWLWVWSFSCEEINLGLILVWRIFSMWAEDRERASLYLWEWKFD